jgi:hypothetical protein
MTARNSLSVKVLDPQTRYAIGYDKEGITRYPAPSARYDLPIPRR